MPEIQHFTENLPLVLSHRVVQTDTGIERIPDNFFDNKTIFKGYDESSFHVLLKMADLFLLFFICIFGHNSAINYQGFQDFSKLYSNLILL